MRTPCCHTFLAFVLKFLNFSQTFIGISIIVYSAYMLHQWEKYLPIPPLPPLAPSPDSYVSVSTIFDTPKVSDQVISLGFVSGLVSGNYGRLKVEASSAPSPWFIYAFMGVGVTLCCISCTGHIAAEAMHGCCLCFYTLLKSVFILLEVALIAFIALDRHWEIDLPEDPTGEIASLREFVETHIDLCKWIGITIIVIQVLCLLLALVLRTMVSPQTKGDDDVEQDGDLRGRAWEPLLKPKASQTSGSVSGDGKAFHSDLWSLRMREKYGLSSSDNTMVNPSNESSSVARKT